MNCPICEEKIQPNWYFCRWCGAALAASSTPIRASAGEFDAALNTLMEMLTTMEASAAQSAEKKAELELMMSQASPPIIWND